MIKNMDLLSGGFLKSDTVPLHFRKMKVFFGLEREALVVRSSLIVGVQAGDDEDLDKEKRRERFER